MLPPIRLRFCNILVGLLLLPQVAACRADEPVSTAATSLGTVSGRVHYHADPNRPWRFSRYYVQDAKQGFLAEAVVALSGSGLNQAQPPGANRPPVQIDQKNFQFVPETVAIQIGQSVKFTNSDAEIHNVKTADGAQPFSTNIVSGGEEIRTFDHAGGTRRPLRLGCAFHGAMRGWVFVFKHSCFQVTAPDGRFRLENVPPGEYRLEMVHPAGDLAWHTTIHVAAGKTENIDIHVSPSDLRTTRNQ